MKRGWHLSRGGGQSKLKRCPLVNGDDLLVAVPSLRWLKSKLNYAELAETRLAAGEKLANTLLQNTALYILGE